MHIPKLFTVLIFSIFLAASVSHSAQLADAAKQSFSDPGVAAIIALVVTDGTEWDEAFETVSENWKPSYAVMIIESVYLTRNPSKSGRMIVLLEEKTGKNFGYELDRWYDWIWNSPEMKHPEYARFKGVLYGMIDPRFRAYFSDYYPAEIRLDEIRWGGVRQDGIPPLRNPKMIKAGEADYLEDSNIVFGIEVNGDARAYPKRIMAWHEMFVDTVGGMPVAGVYCTLCGTMILYKTEIDGVNHALGTSGFLYRSNKLMYDRETESLWNTIWGRPVVGRLADTDIELEKLSVVTTKWGEWKKRHPETKVLSLDTGHRRDYSEGAAYREYFATDEIMFTVPKLDKRLNNKDEVLGLIFPQYPDSPLAVSVEYLSENPVYHDRIGDLGFVVLTDSSGASRVYETKGVKFSSWDRNNAVTDDSGVEWKLAESKLESPDGRTLHRLPAHRAFWFGWYSAYSNTELIM